MRDSESAVTATRAGVRGLCGWCTHPDAPRWHREVQAGASLRDVASRTPFSASAASRHWRNHVRASLTLAVDNNEDAQAPADFAARLMGLADDAARLRQHARTTGNSALLIRAMGAEQSAVTTLMTRLGVDDTETVQTLTTFDLTVTALVRMVMDDPALGDRLADRLDDVGATDFAQEIRWITQHQRGRLRLAPSPDGTR